MASKLLSAQGLLQAINNENISQAASLLIDGACPNLLLPAEGISPFHLAVGCDSRHALQLTTLFLQHNADPNVRSTEGLTPVHVAASWGRFQALELLLWNGGDPSLEDEDGQTAKNMAENSGHWDCINLLDTWMDGHDDTQQEEEEGDGGSFLEIPFAPQNESNDFHDPLCSPNSLHDQVMLNSQSPDKHGRFENSSAAYSWSPGSATSSTLSSVDHEFSRQVLEEDATGEYEISFPKQQRVPSCSPSLQSSYDEMSLNRALLSMNINNYSLSSASNRSSASSAVSLTLSKNIPSQHDVHSEQEASPSRYYDHSEGETSLSADEHTLTSFGLDVTSPDHTVVFTKASAKDRRRTVFCPLQYPSLEMEQRDDTVSPCFPTERKKNEEEQTNFDSGNTEASFSPCSLPESNENEEEQTSFESGNTEASFSPCSLPESNRNEEEQTIFESGNTEAYFSPCSKPESNGHEEEQAVPDASSVSSYHTACSPNSSLCSSLSSKSIFCNRKSGVSLIEDHFLPASGSEPSLLDFSFATADDTIVYDWTSFKSDSVDEDVPQRLEIPPELAVLTNEELKVKLSDLGEDVGPVTATTRSVYLSFLVRLMQDDTLRRPKPKQDSCNINFQYELAEVMNGRKPLPDSQDLEKQMVQQFEEPDPRRKWREGTLKSSFNYLLLDPRVTRDLPSRYPKLTQLETFKTFVSAIFYVGKGKRSRPYAHFEEALDHRKKKMAKKPGSKVLHILDVWSGGMGVVSLHCFQNVIPVEAYTREACMIDAIGMSRLTNAKRGDYYGVAHSWSGSKKRKIGVHLLHKACQIFLLEGERQIRSADISSGQ